MPLTLTEIKLAGFKSFVDPTTIKLSSNLTAIVGPNGCGKSNIMDAVRWVMGESRNKDLRTGNSTDVIFSGSDNRKPVGLASVELRFDNRDGDLGGQWAQYENIAIRRQVTRDGISQYFLNGGRCRRRDIQDVFLGTGIGPRSYSIIEQGMVSKLIEAKPEDLRHFIEEAANISKYKERRRETETRMRQTQDNLERLLDLQQELDKQLKHLARQAKAAQQYQVLSNEKQTLSAQRQALHIQTLTAQRQEMETRLTQYTVELEKINAERQAVETSWEKQQNTQQAYQEQREEKQKVFYEVAQGLSRIEQDMSHLSAKIEQAKADQQLILEEGQQIDEQRTSAMTQLDAVREQAQAQQSALSELKGHLTNQGSQTQAAQQALSQWHHDHQDKQQALNQVDRRKAMEKQHIHHLEQQNRQAQQQQQRFTEELTQLDLKQLENDCEQCEATLQQANTHSEAAQKDYQTLESEIQSLSTQQDALKKSQYEQQGQQQAHQARLASLEALQQAALGQDDAQQKQQLSQLGIDDDRLITQCRVNNAWQKAAEVVLGPFLTTIAVSDHNKINTLAIEQAAGLSLASALSSEVPITGEHAGTLLAEVENPGWLATLFQSIKTAPDAQSALSQRAHLNETQSIITPEGLWCAKHWVIYPNTQTTDAGVFARAEQIETLKVAIVALEDTLKALGIEAKTLSEHLSNKQQAFKSARQALFQQQQAAIQAERAHASIRAKWQAKQQRQRQLTEDIQRLKHTEESQQAQLLTHREQLDKAQDEYHALQSALDALTADKKQHQDALQTAQSVLNDTQKQQQNSLIAQAQYQAEQAALEKTIAQLKQQHDSHAQKQDQLATLIARATDKLPALTQQREEAVNQQSAAQAALDQVKVALTDLSTQLSALNEQRHTLEKHHQQEQHHYSEQQLKWQAVSTQLEGALEQFESTGCVLSEVVSTLEQSSDLKQYDELLGALERKITRLGPINLAAIEEFETQNTRKQYLDEQQADLTEALDLLTKAIAKIDKESKHRFTETFQQINKNFQTLFPKLFGGGRAQLIVKGEDILESGVQVMAQPPGKRNTMIQMLSGGEKALTAVSLVFAIFQLNPAPFCMLDEVDAPLDEANVMRFSEMVKAMSDKTQFIFITHNKVTMESANYLMGVTMKEPGVSRIVAVDVEKATEMIEA